MTQTKISDGLVHQTPSDLIVALNGSLRSLQVWESLTPIARNEWICWIDSVKKSETRAEHVKRAIHQLADGKRRPCCWYGCVHRTDKAVSPSVQALVMERRSRK